VYNTNVDALAACEAEPRTVVCALVVKHVVRRVLLTLQQYHITVKTQATSTSVYTRASALTAPLQCCNY